jgi:O-antigen/teichoic acid export membrane protein
MLKSSPLRKIFLALTGSIAAQIIAISLTPVITRLYSPADLGYLNAFTALTSIILPVSMGMLHVGIVLTKTEKLQIDLARLACLFSIVFSVFIFIFGAFSETMNITDKGFLYVIMVSLFVFVTSIMQLCEQVAIKQERFSLIARCSVIQSLSNNISKIVLAFLGGASGIGLVFCSIIGTGSVVFSYRENIISIIRHKTDLKSLISIAKEYRNFPLFQAPQGVLNAFSHGVPIIFLTHYYGAESAGWYGLSRTVLGIPILLLGNAVSSVLYPRLLMLYNCKKGFHKELISYCIALFLISVLGFSVFVLYGSELFSFVFGIKWAEAGHMSGLMVPFFIFMLASRPIIPAISILSMQSQLLLNEILSVIGKTIALYVGVELLNSASSAILLYSAVGAMIYAIIMVQVFIRAKRYELAHG